MNDKRRSPKIPEISEVAESPKSAHAETGPMPVLRDDALSQIEKLPRDIGWMLLGGGLLSEVVMGLPPFWVVGIMILYPQIGLPLAGLLERRTPKLLAGSLDFVKRYIDDLERRYPRR